ncbi:hypothetical protein GA0116948_102394 [Chitinophaga costaii]|uniref:Uncharacterized protein n=1 Tax=Chitinophaga costaii TaxID=1335309 RepID=A0A1C4B2F6_9BACT|nr:hypothetical protein [Chitinophaga costaii]PUZ26842.1 hypothetical protein DCM91_10650 [Chitinophaga costaii]SCC01061.1 hypothetical protein GA0116948_102394 [Chitinophaga costaii]
MSALSPVYLGATATWLKQSFELPPPLELSWENLEALLARKLETLISEDFHQFIFLLYRIDVPEQAVRDILSDGSNNLNVYTQIAQLIIQRQVQKIITRERFAQPPASADDEERW